MEMGLVRSSLGINPHGTEFQARETAAAITNALLFEDDGPRGNDFDNESDQKDNGNQQWQSEHNASDIKHPLPLWNSQRRNALVEADALRRRLHIEQPE